MDRRYHRLESRASISESRSKLTIVLTIAVVTVVLLSLGSPTIAGASTPAADERPHSSVESLFSEPSAERSLSTTPPVVISTGVETTSEQTTSGEPSTSPVLQSDQRSHLAAMGGIVVLVILGGVLFVRNRIGERAMGERTDQSIGSEDFMTDRERVRKLVTENGGRMKQAEIVDSVEWSKAKVSRLLADLESEDEITKLRLGRENLICLRGQEPQASKSPDGSGSE